MDAPIQEPQRVTACWFCGDPCLDGSNYCSTVCEEAFAEAQWTKDDEAAWFESWREEEK